MQDSVAAVDRRQLTDVAERLGASGFGDDAQ